MRSRVGRAVFEDPEDRIGREREGKGGVRDIDLEGEREGGREGGREERETERRRHETVGRG